MSGVERGDRTAAETSGGSDGETDGGGGGKSRQPEGVDLKRTGTFRLGIFQGAGHGFIWATSLHAVGIENHL